MRSLAAASLLSTLSSALAESPERCLFSGTPTRSHRVEVPYRYVPAFEGAPRTRRGVPRFPSTVATLVGSVSHREWEGGVNDLDLGAPLERVDAGVYELDRNVFDRLREVPVERVALRRLGD